MSSRSTWCARIGKLMSGRPPTDWNSEAMRRRVRRRYVSERRFKALGFAAIAISVIFLAFLLCPMVSNSLGGFMETRVKVAIDFPHSSLMIDPALLKGEQAQQTLASADVEGAGAARGP